MNNLVVAFANLSFFGWVFVLSLVLTLSTLNKLFWVSFVLLLSKKPDQRADAATAFKWRLIQISLYWPIGSIALLLELR